MPKELWRICDNPGSNEWNSEPEKVIRHYRVYAHDADARRYWVELDGWHGFRSRHWVRAESCFFTLADAEKALAGGGTASV